MEKGFNRQKTKGAHTSSVSVYVRNITGGPGSRCEELLFFFIFMRTFRDIVTAVVYCYITTEFHYTKRDSGLLAFGGVMFQRSNLQRFVWEKTLTAILAEIMIFLQ